LDAPARRADTKVRFWAGVATNCLAVWRRARAAGLEAIIGENVCVKRGYRDSKRDRVGGKRSF